jgi:hypothetical protein
MDGGGGLNVEVPARRRVKHRGGDTYRHLQREANRRRQAANRKVAISLGALFALVAIDLALLGR